MLRILSRALADYRVGRAMRRQIDEHFVRGASAQPSRLAGLASCLDQEQIERDARRNVEALKRFDEAIQRFGAPDFDTETGPMERPAPSVGAPDSEPPAVEPSLREFIGTVDSEGVVHNLRDASTGEPFDDWLRGYAEQGLAFGETIDEEIELDLSLDDSIVHDPYTVPRVTGLFESEGVWEAWVDGALVATGPDKAIVEAAYKHHLEDHTTGRGEVG